MISLLTFACTPRTAIPSTDRPPAEDIPLVTYAEISTFMQRSCSPCHYPDQQGRVTPLDTYQAVKRHLGTVIQRVELPRDDHAFMPYEMKREPLSREEIQQLKHWAWGGYRKG